MLYQICEDLSNENIESMVFLIDDLPRSVKISSAEELVHYLEQQQDITAQDLTRLVTLLVQADRSDLVTRVNAFRGEKKKKKWKKIVAGVLLYLS